MTTETDQAHWTEAVYCDNARLLYDVEAALFQNEELTRRELAAVQRLGETLGCGFRSSIIDIACGPGRHSIQLANDGHDVTGLDFSPGLLELASESAVAAKNGGRTPTFVAGDMRRLDFDDSTFNTALMLGNSFGYFSDEENVAALREACRVLSAGGFLCLEMTDKQKYLSSFEAHAEEIVEGRFHSRLRCEWSKRWNPDSQRLTTHEKHSVADTGEVLYEGPYEVRLFDEEEITGLLESLGLRSVTCLPFSPGKDSLAEGLGETYGALEEILFVGGIK